MIGDIRMGVKVVKKNDTNTKYLISFYVSGDDFMKTLNIVRTLKGRYFDPIHKQWEADICPTNEKILKDNGFTFNFLDTQTLQTLQNKNLFKPVDTCRLPPQMYPYQIKAVEFLEAHNGVAFLGDDMGCISGEALIYVSTHYKNKTWKDWQIPFWRLYERSAQGDYTNENLNVYIVAKGRQKLQLGLINNITYMGKKQTIELITDAKKSVRATPDHLFFKYNEGWVPLELLNVGDTIITKLDEDRTYTTSKIISLKDFGEEDVYDMSIRGTNNNFFANNILVHNCGKTLEVLGYCKLHEQEFKKILVVCPPTAKYVWEKEIKQWVKQSVQVISHTNEYISDARYTVIPYSILDFYIDQIKRARYDLVIGDEAHYIANSSAIRTKAFKQIVKNKKHTILMSGTPIRNYPANFYNALHIIAPSIFHNKRQYYIRYCDYKFNGFAWEAKGATNIEELHQLIQPFVLRRLKEEVLPELPLKTRNIVPLDMNLIQVSEYKHTTENFIKWAEENHKRQLDATHMEVLKQIAYLGKRDAVIEWIKNFLETGKKLVVFAWNKEVIKDLHNVFKRVSVTLHGESTNKERKENIEKFQNDPSIKLFIGQIIAAGVSITLTAASDVAFIQFPYTAADVLQAEDRCLRIGQNNKVFIYYLVAVNTIEERIALLIEKKFKVANKIIDGNDTEMFDGQDFISLLTEELLTRK